MNYKCPVSAIYEKRLKAIGAEKLKAAKAQLQELDPDCKDMSMYNSFLIKVYECGQSKYRIPKNEIGGKWDGKEFLFTLKNPQQDIDIL